MSAQIQRYRAVLQPGTLCLICHSHIRVKIHGIVLVVNQLTHLAAQRFPRRTVNGFLLRPDGCQHLQAAGFTFSGGLVQIGMFAIRDQCIAVLAVPLLIYMFVTGICLHFARKALRIQFRSGIGYSRIRIFCPIAVREGSAALQRRRLEVQFADGAAGNGKKLSTQPFYFLHASRKNTAAAIGNPQDCNIGSFYAYGCIIIIHLGSSCNPDVLLEHRCFSRPNIGTTAPQFPASL